jgi:hypothetical protein
MHSHIHMWYTCYSSASCVAMDKQSSHCLEVQGMGPPCSRRQGGFVHPQALEASSFERHAGGGAAPLLNDFMATASTPHSEVPGL